MTRISSTSKPAGLLLAVFLIVAWSGLDRSFAADPEAVLAMVGDDRITEADFQLYCAINNLPVEKQAEKRQELIQVLVDRQLMRRHLKRQKIAPDPKLLAGEIVQIETLIRARKKDPEKLLQHLGLTRQALEAEIGLSLAWQAYVHKTITEAQIDEYYQQHEPELDGTKFRASHIILKTKPNPTAEELSQRQAKLSAVRQEILARKLTFADAAKLYSEARGSKYKGGDVGWFAYRGTQPDVFGDVAIKLKDGEISEPTVSPFGVHLIQITERQPGQLTLEDVRTEVIGFLAKELWDNSIAAERMKSKVVMSGN